MLRMVSDFQFSSGVFCESNQFLGHQTHKRSLTLQRIPQLFSRAYNEELSSTAILTVSTGESWEVALIKEDNNIWLSEGWQEFVEYFSITFAYCLLFLYQGNSKFEVHIFSPTACEISYPCNAHNKFPEENPVKKEESKDDSGTRNNYGNEASEKRDEDIVSDGFTVYSISSDGDTRLGADEGRMYSSETIDEKQVPSSVNSLSSDDDDMELGADEGSMLSSKTNDDANQVTSSVDDENRGTQSDELMEALTSVGISMPQKPFFVVVIKKYNIYKGCFVYIPSDFVQKYLIKCKAKKYGTLEASNGKQWEVGCYMRIASSFRTGWIVFAREDRLKVGDVCAFELIDAQNIHERMELARNKMLEAQIAIHNNTQCRVLQEEELLARRPRTEFHNLSNDAIKTAK